VAQRIFVLAPRGRDAGIIADVLAGVGAAAIRCGDLATLATTLDERASAVVATEEDLAGPALGVLLTWVARQPSWSDLPFLVLGAPRATRSAAQSALLASLGNAVLLERPLAAEALATAARAALRARGRQFQVREEVATREDAVQRLRELNQDLEHRVESRTAELRASETRFRAYFESFPDPLFVVGVTERGTFAYESLNPESERLLGVRSAEVEGKPPEAFLDAPTAEIANTEFRRCVELGRAHAYTNDFPHRGKTLTFDMVVTPLRDANGRIVRLLGVARDVTQQRQVEERLRQAQKLEALGQLTGGIAHDFNNVLQVVTSGLVLLERANDKGDPGRRAKLIGSMRQATGRAAELVRRLLTFARRQALHPETVALGPWLDAQARVLLSRALRGDVLVHTRLAPDLPPVRADVAELELAVLNLALNARDAMPSGGELLVEAEPAQLAAGGNPEGLEGSFVRLSVSDTGTGMTPEIVGRLFEPFFTTKEPGKGTGLGLAQVYGFARQSGGAVRVSSEPGQGTTVSLLLPIANGVPEAAPTRPSLPPLSADRSLSILVCEDDDVVAALVCELLDQLGHRTRRVANAAEALAALDEDDPEDSGPEDSGPEDSRVDLLLTDIIMPGGMDGAALAHEAMRRHPGLRVLLTTGYQGNAEANGLRILRKPYHLQDLAAALAAASAPLPGPASFQEAVQGVAVPNTSRSPA
jgi:PAS domain S-box-containing protein